MVEGIQFSNLQEFFEMGGYAFNVWSVYVIFGVFVAINLLLPMIRRGKIVKELKRRAAFEKAETESLREP